MKFMYFNTKGKQCNMNKIDIINKFEYDLLEYIDIDNLIEKDNCVKKDYLYAQQKLKH